MRPKSQVRNGLMASAVIKFQAKNLMMPVLPGSRSFQVILECKR